MAWSYIIWMLSWLGYCLSNIVYEGLSFDTIGLMMVSGISPMLWQKYSYTCILNESAWIGSDGLSIEWLSGWLATFSGIRRSRVLSIVLILLSDRRSPSQIVVLTNGLVSLDWHRWRYVCMIDIKTFLSRFSNHHTSSLYWCSIVATSSCFLEDKGVWISAESLRILEERL